MEPRPSHAELAASFGAAADVYARARPSYPDDALEWLLPAHARRVLDLGAGTGKLTVRLVDRGLDVAAVEPSEGMRSELERALGDRGTILPGTAEAIPLPDASCDAVLVAQAWHWVDPARAVPEVARVLRPGGRLGLLWNRRDERVPWVGELTRLIAPPDAVARATERARPDERDPQLGPPFGAPERFVSAPWSDPITPAGLVELAASRSSVITLPSDERDALLDRVRALADAHPDLAGRREIDMPYRTFCVRAPRA